MPRENREENLGTPNENELKDDYLETSELQELREKIDYAISEVKADIELTQSQEYKENPGMTRIRIELETILANLMRAKYLAERGDERSFQIFNDYNEIHKEKRDELLETANTKGGALETETLEKDQAEVLKLTLEEALQTYRESLATDGDPETAKSKAVRKIYEITTGEYDHLIPEAIGRLEAGLGEEPAFAEATAGKPAEAQPPRPTRPEAEPKAESEFSEEEKDAIVQTTLDVFRQELKVASVSAAEEAAREKFKEATGRLSRKDHEELRQRITQEINALEAEERRKMVATRLEPASAEVFDPEVSDRRATAGKPAERESVEPAPAPSDLSRAESREVEGPAAGQEGQERDDIAALREQAQKLGMAFSEGMSAEEIKKRIEERLEFDRRTQAPGTLPEPAPAPPSTGPEGPLRPSNGSQVEAPPELPVETPTPPPVEIKTEAEKLPPSELTAEELETVFAVAKAERVDDLPRNVQEKLSRGLNEATFWVEGNKNKFFSGAIEKAEEKLNLDKKGTLGRFVNELAETWRRDQIKAKEKFEAANTISNIASLSGNILRYGRLALDMTGYSVVAPLRFVTLGAMGFARGAEAAKEARFKNEEVIEKTRVDNLDRAEADAWRIYEEAQRKAGDGEVTSGELKLAFLESLPSDIKERLIIGAEGADRDKIAFARKLVENIAGRWINSSLERVRTKLNQTQTEAERQKILKKYEGRLNDFNRLVGDYGQIDALAMGAKISEGLAKGIRQAMTVETLFELPFAAEKIWSDLAGILGEKPEVDQAALGAAELTGPEREKLVDLYDRVLGVDSKDGLDVNEAAKITGFAREAVVTGQPEELAKVLDTYGGMEVKDTGKTLENLIKESIPAAETIPAPEPIPTLEPEPIAKPELPPEPAPAPQESPAEPTLKVSPEAAPTPEIKPGRFENTIEPGGDSIWRSTREIFTKNAREFGFDPAKDGDLEKWAETKTANAVKELADKEYSGKIKDLVHTGDKVTIEIGPDGRPHLKFENLSGIKPSYLAESETLKAAPSAGEVETPSPSPNGAEEAEIKIDSTAAASNAAETEKLAREYQALPMDSSRDEFVYNYIIKEVNKPEYQQLSQRPDKPLKLPHLNEEKLIAFARMFGGGDWASISSPEKLAQTLIEFDNNLKFYTQRLVDGSLDRIFREGGERAMELTHNIFPLESQDGEILYAQMQKGGKWRIANSSGEPLELRRPIMRKTDLFDLKNVKKLLGY